MAQHRSEPGAPSWFTDACAWPATSNRIDLDSCTVHFLTWEPPTAPTGPPVVLLHGTAAHAHWWDHLAPQLAADGHRVAALDLSGHGDSDHRDAYDLDLWADEAGAVAAALDPEGAGVLLIGHSLGGVVAATAAIRPGVPVVGVVQIETMLDTMGAHPEDMPSGPRRTYPTQAEALARFRLVPAQRHPLPFVLEHLAHGSIVEQPDGWTWKYDRALAAGLRSTVPKATDLVPLLRSPFAVIHGEHGVVTREDAAVIAASATTPAPTIELLGAGHHPMVDQPLALLAALRQVLAGWALDRPADYDPPS